MTKFKQLILVSALVAPGFMIAAAPAQAQSVAVLDPDAAIGNTNAWKTAAASIQSTYKTQIQAAQQSQPTQWRAAQAKQASMNAELQQLSAPISRARAYALEQISSHEEDAVSNAMKAHNVTVLLNPQATFIAQPSADLTPAVTTELDRLITAPVSISPPANWQPGQQKNAPAAAPAASTQRPSQGR
jgi:Skp family chaperone for outer membrane proteins